jgi:hypothetical protein
MKKIFLIAVFAALVAAPLAAQTPDFKALLKTIDEMGNFDNQDFSVTYKVVTNKPGEGVKESKAKLFRRDSQEKFLMYVLSPSIEAGNAYLKVGDALTFYNSKNHTTKTTSMKEAFQDSDANNSDLKASTLSEDYDIVSTSSDTFYGKAVWVIKLKAKTNDVTYDKQDIYVEKATNQIMQSKSYSPTNTLMRTAIYADYAFVGGQMIPLKMRFIDEVNAGEKTDITLIGPTITKIDDNYFNKINLEKLSIK